MKACGKYAIKIVGVYIMHTMLCVYNSAHARGPLLSTVNGSDRSRAKQNLNGSSGGWIHAAAGLNSLCATINSLFPPAAASEEEKYTICTLSIILNAQTRPGTFDL